MYVQLFCGYLIMMASLNMCLTSNVGRQNVEVIRDYDGDFFTNPDNYCNVNSCREYNSTAVGGYCSSSDRCCSQCRCNMHIPTYIVHEKQCMSLERFRKAQKLDEIHYLMGQLGNNCTDACSEAGGVCLSEGHGFSNSSITLSIFNSLNVSCKRDYNDINIWTYGDNPAYATGGKWKGRCLGFKNIPDKIYCSQGGNPIIRRLCPCKGKKDCRYWLVEKNGGNECSSPPSKIPLVYLSTKQSVRLTICGQAGSQITERLLSCTLEEVKYKQQARWKTFAEKERRLFEIRTPTVKGSTNDIMLKWNKLDSDYDGIVGYMKIKCNVKGELAMLCFIFKSNGSRRADYVPTSPPLVSTDTEQRWSTPTKVTTSSSSTRSKGDFEKKKKDSSKDTTTIAAVSTSVVVFLLICVIIIVIFYWKRRKRRGTASSMEHLNPTYGKGPGNTLFLHGRGNDMAAKQEGLNEYDNTYEIPDSGTISNVSKTRNGRTANPVEYSDTYETIDPSSPSTYYCAKDVVNGRPDEPENTAANVYNVLVNPSENLPEESENQDAYNVITNHCTSGAKGNEKEMQHYDVLERAPVTDVRYQDDEHVYHYAK